MPPVVNTTEYDYDMIVVGGGSGGMACAKAAAGYGAKVACLDFVQPSPKGSKWGLGGTCVNVGCIPKKLMHQAALLGESIHDAKSYGWKLPEEAPKHDWLTMVDNVQDYIHALNFGYKVALRDKKVKYLNAYGTFVDAHTMKTVDKKGKEATITAQTFVIATGGRPLYPDIPGAKEFGITSDDIFSLDKAPGKTLVVGASYVALECAGFLAGLGFDTTVMVRSILLRGFDQECAEKIGAYMKEESKVKFIRPATPSKLEKAESGKVSVSYSIDGEDKVEEYDTVLFATGRYACTDGIGLDTVGVKLHEKSRKVLHTESEQTNISNIYGIGDVLHGKLELTPVAIQAGQRLAARLYANSSKLTNYINIPTTVFTPIEYGAIGYSEEDAITTFGADNIEVYHLQYTPLEYSLPHRTENTCFAKLITNLADNERVVGFHVMGPNSGEVTQGFGIAFTLNATKADFDDLIGIHPTVAEMMTVMTITKRSGESAVSRGC